MIVEKYVITKKRSIVFNTTKHFYILIFNRLILYLMEYLLCEYLICRLTFIVERCSAVFYFITISASAAQAP